LKRQVDWLVNERNRDISTIIVPKSLPALAGQGFRSGLRYMRRCLLMVSVIVVALSCAVPKLSAQVASGSNPLKSEAVLSKLFPPVYPRLAQQARIMGDVELTVHARRDGSVESAEVVSGHPMLKQASLDSAQQSQFECRLCGEATTPYSLTYQFRITPRDPYCRGQAIAQNSCQGLSDGGGLVRQHRLQGQVLAITNKNAQADRNGKLSIAD
jgi:TonB family protein